MIVELEAAWNHVFLGRHCQSDESEDLDGHALHVMQAPSQLPLLVLALYQE